MWGVVNLCEIYASGSAQMLPDFPLLKGRVLKSIGRRASAEMFNDPMLSQVHHISHHEGNRFEGFSQEGLGEHDYHQAVHELGISTSELISVGVDAIVRRIPEIVGAMTSQAKNGLLSTMKKAAQVSGNEVSMIGREPTPEDVLAVFERMPLEFDARGRPKLGSILIVSGKSEAMQRSYDQLTSDPNYRERFEALIEKKRTEWNSRESSRTLVD